MTDQELRALVRDAVARHLGPRAGAPPAPLPPPARASSAPGHPSHHIYIALANMDDACVVEPAVACSHCNYCRSHGH